MAREDRAVSESFEIERRKAKGRQARAQGRAWMQKIVRDLKVHGFPHAIMGDQNTKNRAQTWADVEGVHLSGGFHAWIEAKCVLDFENLRFRPWLQQAEADSSKASRVPIFLPCRVSSVRLEFVLCRAAEPGLDQIILQGRPEPQFWFELWKRGVAHDLVVPDLGVWVLPYTSWLTRLDSTKWRD